MNLLRSHRKLLHMVVTVCVIIITLIVINRSSIMNVVEGYTGMKISSSNSKATMNISSNWTDNNSNVCDMNTTVDVPSSWMGTNTINECINSSLEGNKGGSSPFSENTLSFFTNTVQSPSCCPSTYSSSSGCLCLSSEQMKYLNERGGNRTQCGF